MTAALLCDGCGRLASTADPTDDDPTRRWWELSPGPTPSGGLLALTVPPITIDEFLHPVEEPEPEPEEEPESEPLRHFCSDSCLFDWLGARINTDEKGPSSST